MWKDILKMPIVDELDNDDRFNIYLGNPELFTQQVSSHNYQWESEDGNARAQFSLLVTKIIPVWYIDVFEIAKDSRGKGKSRQYLEELVADIREKESNIDIEEVISNNPEIRIELLYGKDGKTLDVFKPPYKIVGKGLWDTKEFWDKMIEEKIVDGYLGY